MLQVKTSVELSGKREVCSFRRNSTRMALPWSAELEQLLAQAISELYPVGSWEGRGEVDAGRTVGKCNVCQAVNEQFHGNIVTLLLTAIGAEFLGSSSSSSSPASAPTSAPTPSPSPAGVTIHLLVVPMLA